MSMKKRISPVIGMAVAMTLGVLAATMLPSVAAEQGMDMAEPATAAQHAAEAEKYDKEAAELKAKADMHYKRAKNYLAHASSGSKQSGSYRSVSNHCKRLADAYAAAADEAREMARAHRELSAGG